MVHAMSYQFSRGSMQSIWGALGIARRAAVRPGMRARPDRRPPCCGCGASRTSPPTAARMAALCAAILIGLQLAADYWAFLYLVWVMPLIGLSVLSGSGHPSRRRDRRG